MPHTDSSSPARLFRELARIHVRAQRAEVARHVGSAESKCTMLTELGRAKGLSLGELAARLKLDKGWVSRTVDQMEADGTVTRVVNPVDARGVLVSLTATGRRQQRRLDHVLDSQIERVFARIRSSDRQKVSTALSLLYDAYQAEVAGGDAAAQAAAG